MACYGRLGMVSLHLIGWYQLNIISIAFSVVKKWEIARVGIMCVWLALCFHALCFVIVEAVWGNWMWALYAVFVLVAYLGASSSSWHIQIQWMWQLDRVQSDGLGSIIMEVYCDISVACGGEWMQVPYVSLLWCILRWILSRLASSFTWGMSGGMDLRFDGLWNFVAIGNVLQ